MNYRTRILSSLSDVGQSKWDELVSLQEDANPFLSFAFLDALHESGAASSKTGWECHYITIWKDNQLEAALPLYAKMHSYGEYVFDWAWADAYRKNGLRYYPKLVSSIPFTPVTGSRLLSRNAEAQAALMSALHMVQEQRNVSSTHILYPSSQQAHTFENEGYMLRRGVQFHWVNQHYRSFEDFLSTLESKKSKNIRAERRKVQEAGVTFRHVPGQLVTEADWRFFQYCYERTYAEHYSTPYLNLDFFLRIGTHMPQHILLIVAERDGRPIASSLLIYTDKTLYGRYWGAIERVPCLHFETAYYQPLDFCIAHEIEHFEGGAQGEHKIARGFIPQNTWSAHWLAHPAFSEAIDIFLQEENNGIESYIDELNEHSPFKNN